MVNVSFPQVYHMPDAFVKHFGRGMIVYCDSVGETDVPHQNTGLRSTCNMLPDSWF